MFYYLDGILTIKQDDIAVIDCSGVGYMVKITYNTYLKLPQVNEKVKIFTHLNVREDAMELFGFSDNEELSSFKMLISVSGIGPKTALNILSVLTPSQFAIAVATNDVKSISKAQGIGAKGASRIILELKDKITKEQLDTSDDISGYNANSTCKDEALQALVVLGYTKSEASSVLAKIDCNSETVDNIIKKALVMLMR